MLAALGAAVVIGLPLVIHGFSGGPPPRRTGAPGDGLCTGCHAGTVNPAGGGVTVSFPGGMNYIPGVRQEWTVTINDAQARLFGFQLTTRLASNEANGQAGDLAAVGTSTQVICENGSAKGTQVDPSVRLVRVQFVICENGSAKGTQGCLASAPVQFIQHFPARSTNTYTVAWTPPDRDVGNVRVYVAGNGANGDGRNTGDHIYTNSYTLTPAAVSQDKPSIAADNGVVNGASFRPGIASGSWVSIFGTNLAPSTRIWRADEIVGGKLPTELDGVRVTINNKPAAVYYISPTQLNVQAPTDESLGSVAVQVVTAQGASNIATAAMQAFAPALFTFDPENRRYAASQHADFSLVAKPGLFAGVTTRGARPGEVILLYGTGFGATRPPVPAGQVVSAPAPLANPVSVRMGGVEAELSFAGLTGAGLYQFNVKVPEVLPEGDAAVVLEIGGVRSPEGVFVTVQR